MERWCHLVGENFGLALTLWSQKGGGQTVASSVGRQVGQRGIGNLQGVRRMAAAAGSSGTLPIKC